MSRFAKYFIISFSFANFLAFTISPARAANTSLAVSPAILEVIVIPGESVENHVMIKNLTNIPLPIKGSVKNFTIDDKSVNVKAETFDASSWFALEPADFILQPTEEKQVKVTVSAPAGIEPGGHYATIYFEPLIPADAVSPTSALSLARVGILTFLVAPGNINEDLKINRVNLPRWQISGPVNFSIEMENQGNIHIMPSGTLIFTDLFGRQVDGGVPFPPSAVLPGTSKKVDVVWEGKWLFGRYKLSGDLVYRPDGLKVSLPPSYIWILPLHIIAILSVILTSITYFAIVGRKRITLAWKIISGKSDTSLD